MPLCILNITLVMPLTNSCLQLFLCHSCMVSNRWNLWRLKTCSCYRVINSMSSIGLYSCNAQISTNWTHIVSMFIWDNYVDSWRLGRQNPGIDWLSIEEDWTAIGLINWYCRNLDQSLQKSILTKPAHTAPRMKAVKWRTQDLTSCVWDNNIGTYKRVTEY